MRSGKPDPLAANIVHVREDRCNGADLAGWFGSPGSRIKVFDKNLVYAIINGKDFHCGLAERSLNLVLTRGHGSLPLDLYYFRAFGHPDVTPRVAHSSCGHGLRSRWWALTRHEKCCVKARAQLERAFEVAKGMSQNWLGSR